MPSFGTKPNQEDNETMTTIITLDGDVALFLRGHLGRVLAARYDVPSFSSFRRRSNLRVNAGFIKLLVGLHPIGMARSIA